MVILDTNHLSALERRGPEAERLLARLAIIPVQEVKITIISYEEQIRGWMEAIARAKSAEAQVFQYQRLREQLENYCNLDILPFDSASAQRFEELRAHYRRLSAPDLKIAAITLVHSAILLTRNERDFRGIEGLQVEDWTL